MVLSEILLSQEVLVVRPAHLSERSRRSIAASLCLYLPQYVHSAHHVGDRSRGLAPPRSRGTATGDM